MRLRSISVRILLVGLVTLVLSVAAGAAIFLRFTAPLLERAFLGFHTVAVEEAEDALDRGGPPALAAYLRRRDMLLDERHYLTDASGRDVLSHEDRSALLAADPRGDGKPVRDVGQMIVVRASQDGRYRLIMVAHPPFSLVDMLPYHALLLVTVALVCWGVALSIGRPLQRMASVVRQFGRGDLSARTGLARRDEIGDLARAFDAMAERIETLVTAERRLLRDVSHELRSPLTRLNIAIALSRNADDRVTAAARLQRESDRLASLIGTLLEVTRLEGEGHRAAKASVDVAALVREVVADCELEATACGTALRVVDQPAPETRGDPELLRRAFENVVRNAIRYAPRGSTVEVSCTVESHEIVVRVRDEGPGVPEELLSALGTPFFRIDPSRESAAGGVGLGLAIARRAIHLHHGRWAVENAHPGLRVMMTVPSHEETALPVTS